MVKTCLAEIRTSQTKVFLQVCVFQARNSDAPVESSCLDTSVVEAETRARLGMAASPAFKAEEAPEEPDDSWLYEDR